MERSRKRPPWRGVRAAVMAASGRPSQVLLHVAERRTDALVGVRHARRDGLVGAALDIRALCGSGVQRHGQIGGIRQRRRHAPELEVAEGLAVVHHGVDHVAPSLARVGVGQVDRRPALSLPGLVVDGAVRVGRVVLARTGEDVAPLGELVLDGADRRCGPCCGGAAIGCFGVGVERRPVSGEREHETGRHERDDRAERPVAVPDQECEHEVPLGVVLADRFNDFTPVTASIVLVVL
jgi:hypothetical protein